MCNKRVGIIAEGITDQIIIKKVIMCLYPNEKIIFEFISPIPSEIAQSKRLEGFGWGGVYKICKSLSQKLGLAENTSIHYDMIVIHLDGNVMFTTY